MRGRGEKIIALVLTASLALYPALAAGAEQAGTYAQPPYDRTVNDAAVLADGDYQPDSFSWSGGTGKTSISCSKITVENGKVYATIAFSSENYQYVKAGGTQTTGSRGDGSAVFEIPVDLNANNKIYAMTTAMSEPHEIEYTLYIGLKAAQDTTAEKSGGDGAAEEESGQTTALGIIREEEDAPELAGLTYVGSLVRDCAENFRVHYYEDDFVVLEIDVANDTARTDLNEDGSVLPQENAETESFYGETTVKYLLVPGDAEIPAGLDREMLTVRRPAENAYVASGSALEMLDKMNVLDKVAAVGFPQEECGVENAAKAMEEGEIAYAGSYRDLQFRDLVTAKSDLAIVPAEILPEAADGISAADADDATAADEASAADADDTIAADEASAMDADDATAANRTSAADAEGQVAAMKELGDRLALLGIPMVIDRSSSEKEELGQCEWCKVYGLLFGNEEAAVKRYEDAAKALDKTEKNAGEE